MIILVSLPTKSIPSSYLPPLPTNALSLAGNDLFAGLPALGNESVVDAPPVGIWSQYPQCVSRCFRNPVQSYEPGGTCFRARLNSTSQRWSHSGHRSMPRHASIQRGRTER